MAAVVDVDGSVAFVGRCRVFSSEILAEFQQAYKAWWDAASPQPVAWVDRDPALRILDPEETPPEIFDQLTLVGYQVVVTEAWTHMNAALCSRIPALGWNECIPLNQTGTDRLTGTATGGEPVEFWLLDTDHPRITEPLLYLGSIPGDVAIEGDGTTVTLELDTAVTSISDARQREGSLINRLP